MGGVGGDDDGDDSEVLAAVGASGDAVSRWNGVTDVVTAVNDVGDVVNTVTDGVRDIVADTVVGAATGLPGGFSAAVM